MLRIRLAPEAENDIESILAWTHENFGEQLRIRYEALLVRAIADVATDPERLGIKERDEIRKSVRTYHLFHSRNNVDKVIGRIRKPRHFLVLRLVGTDVVEIGRILHDSVDFPAHVPPEYEPDAE